MPGAPRTCAYSTPESFCKAANDLGVPAGHGSSSRTRSPAPGIGMIIPPANSSLHVPQQTHILPPHSFVRRQVPTWETTAEPAGEAVEQVVLINMLRSHGRSRGTHIMESKTTMGPRDRARGSGDDTEGKCGSRCVAKICRTQASLAACLESRRGPLLQPPAHSSAQRLIPSTRPRWPGPPAPGRGANTDFIQSQNCKHGIGTCGNLRLF